jgi:putative acetyltransferase
MAERIQIRAEAAEDRALVRRVNGLAFGREEEAALVERLHDAGAVVLSLVAVEAREIVGHILFSPVTIEAPSGSFEAVGLAPMAVLPDFQGRGIGSRLVGEGLGILERAGHDAVFVLGHPDYYPRFGFLRASRFGIRWETDCPDEAFMALELFAGALRNRRGVVRFRPEFAGL